MTSSNLSRSKAVLSDEGSLLVSDATGDGNALQVGQRQVTVNLGRRSNSGKNKIFFLKRLIKRTRTKKSNYNLKCSVMLEILQCNSSN
jgi:hypothetical protein